MFEIRKCQDCGNDFVAATDAPKEEVCGPCYEAFSGMTIEELEAACLAHQENLE
jgi:hypothetical protein